MGLNKGNENSKKIVSIAEGKLCLRIADGSPEVEGERSRTYKDKNDVEVAIREEVFQSIDGMICGVEFVTGDYGCNMLIDMEDDGDEFAIRLTMGKALTDSIIKRMPNIDVGKPVVFGVGTDKTSGKTYTFVQQDGETVPMAFTKEAPNGLPAWKQKKDKTWNHDECDDFLFEVAEKFAKRVNPVEES